MGRLFLLVLLLTTIPSQAGLVRDRTPDEINTFMTRLITTDKQCRIKLGIVNPPYADHWVLGCGLGNAIFSDSFERVE